jgi:hexosaminidase
MPNTVGAASRTRLLLIALCTAVAAVGTIGTIGVPERIAESAGMPSPDVTAASAPPTDEASPAEISEALAVPDRRPELVPKPVSLTTGEGHFVLGRNSKITASGAARAIAEFLRASLRPATGFPLPITTGPARPGDIALALADPGTLNADTLGEGYQLKVTETTVTLTAITQHGLFNGVQTVKQLLPGWIAGPTAQPGPWTMPVVQITDYPRYAYRGMMIDIARHYQSPAAVEKLIDEAAAAKINTLHLHLSDDQGFRIAIDGFPRLTQIGARGSVGTDGRAMDSGGFWTQAQFADVVYYAADRFVSVVPEVDTPGHNNAIIVSEYGDNRNPLLNGTPGDINCSIHHPPYWNYRGAVGYSALCPASHNTWKILGAIIEQLARLSSSKYYNIGGDEVPGSVLRQDQYASFVNREDAIVRAHGKTVMGWVEIAGAGTHLSPGSVAEYWHPASGSTGPTVSARQAVAKGMQIVMAPATHAYLDQKYSRTAPDGLGLTWACGQRGCDVDQFYNWEPSNYVTGVTDANVIGVEGALWGETTKSLRDAEYLAFPRLLALAELGWSPKAVRTASSSPAYRDFLVRLGAQGTRLTASGVNFYPSTQVPWSLDAIAARGPDRTNDINDINGILAKLSAPGLRATDITATIDWGDHTASVGTVAGRAATGSVTNGIYSVSGKHNYQAGIQRGCFVTVRVTAPGKDAVTVRLDAVPRTGVDR